MSTEGFAFPKPQRPAKKERKQRTFKPRREHSPEESAWLDRVHREPCVGIADFPGHVCWSPDADNPIDASHVGLRGADAGMGLRGTWLRTIPKCRRLHMQLHALSGPFKGWTRERLRSWGMAHVRRLAKKFAGRA